VQVCRLVLCPFRGEGVKHVVKRGIPERSENLTGRTKHDLSTGPDCSKSFEEKPGRGESRGLLKKKNGKGGSILLGKESKKALPNR